MWSTNIACFISYICYFAHPIFAVTPIVDLTYARYQGVPTLDTVNNATNTQFLGIRYAATPTGKRHIVLFHTNIDCSLPITGSRRFRDPQLPSYTPGVQIANKQPSECLQAGIGTAPKTPFRNTDTSPTETRVSLGVSGGSEDCLFLKYIFTLIDICHIFTTIVAVFTFLAI
jgi:Carboxylesterase family